MAKLPIKQPTPTPIAATAVATALAPNALAMTEADDMEAFAGGGMEKVTPNDLLIPRLTIVQALRPQRKKQDPLFIPGCEEGDVVDVGTNEIIPRPIIVIPVIYDKVWLEWYPRNTNKGLANIHTDASILEQCKVNERRQPILPNGNYVAETAQIYLLNGALRWRPTFLPFGSTQLKKARRWMTLASNERLLNSQNKEFLPPLFYRSYELDTVAESNAEGDWYGWTIMPGKAMPELDSDYKNTLLPAAVAFLKSIQAGQVRGDTSGLADDAVTVDASTDDSRRM